LETNEVDLMITDIKMPVMDGLELCRETQNRWPSVMMILLSGYGEFDFARQAIEYGVSSYLLKPIVNEQLEETLRVLNQKVLAKRELSAMALGGAQYSGGTQEARSIHRSRGAIVERAKEIILRHYQEPLSLSNIAERIGVSPNYLSELFTKETGENYKKYLTGVRMRIAAQYIQSRQNIKLSEIAQKTGFVSSKHFFHTFKSHFGVTPSEYKLLSATN
jgi:two-component system response regulator YesN